MKFSHLLFFLIPALFLNCKKDDDKPAEIMLQHDGPNFSGPLLVAGEHELAVSFPASQMTEYTGKKLREVRVYVGPQLPRTCLVRVYQKGSDKSPGNKVYEANVTNILKPAGWNNFKISPGINLTGESLWLGVYVEHSVEQQSIGCDNGPRKVGGDWLFQGADLAWKTYQERTGESVNWNIRGVVE